MENIENLHFNEINLKRSIVANIKVYILKNTKNTELPT